MACSPSVVAWCSTHSVRANFAFAAPSLACLPHASQHHCLSLRVSTRQNRHHALPLVLFASCQTWYHYVWPPFSSFCWLMIALLVLSAALYKSHKTVWKESSRSPSLASSSAHSLPGLFQGARLALLWTGAPCDVCLLEVTEASQIRRHTSACGLLPAEHHFWPRSKPRSTAAQSKMKDAPHSNKIIACSKAQSSARTMRRCTWSEIDMAQCTEQTSSCVASLLCTTAQPVCPSYTPRIALDGSVYKQFASKTVADNTRVHHHTKCATARASTSVLFQRIVHQASPTSVCRQSQSSLDADESEEY